MWTITNNGPTAVVVYDVSARPRTVEPGATVNVDTNERQAARFAGNKALHIRDQDGNVPGPYKPRKQIQAGRDAVRRHDDGAQRATQRRSQERVVIQEEVRSRGDRARDLLAAYDHQEITYHQLCERAKPLFGADWPPSIPKKSTLFAMLNGIED